MVGSSMISKDYYHICSISMPTKSHPVSLRVEEVLNKLNNCTTISKQPLTNTETIRNGLVNLAELYNCVEEFLRMPLNQQALSHHHHEKWVEEMLDESVRLLDVCNIARDLLLQMKCCIQDLQSFLRRRRGGYLDLERKVGTYFRLRKKMSKDFSKCLATLRRMNHKFLLSSVLVDENKRLSMTVVKMLSEVLILTIAIFRSLSSFISSASLFTSKQSRWSLISKLMCKAHVVSEGVPEDVGEVEHVEAELYTLCKRTSKKEVKVGRVQKVQKGLDRLEVNIEGMEAGLDCMFRQLIRTRVSLQNIFTH